MTWVLAIKLFSDARCITKVGESRQVPELLAVDGHWSKGPQMVGQLVALKK